MFNKILIANRGEIALRIIRACRELGIRTVIAHSSADRDSLPVQYADERICIGPGESIESYLNIPHILSAVEATDADAVHPGYGFLAESLPFVEVCETSHIAFVGPSSENIQLMGDKSLARETVKKNRVPVLPGSDGLLKNPEEAKKIAKKIKYPVIVKASGGGGGRGMKVVRTEDEMESAYLACQEEARLAFDNPNLYLEKFLERPRHIEVQILGDNFGNYLCLWERDCSLQRRHQKLIEESPAPLISQRFRRKLAKLAIRVAKAVNYTSVGTIEFLVDSNFSPYFMEMNTRIQVEHPITELVTNTDIIREQIRIAEGERLSLRQKDISLSGVAMECRINAEDTENNFLPSPGKITRYIAPGGPGIRLDTHIHQGYQVPAYYDSLLAKLISYGRNRREAIFRMQRALGEMKIEGIKTTIPFYKKIFSNPLYLQGKYYVGFIETILENNKK
ncbi:MAG: acetyl-CoA carboxylase biotin carboxylase subunit [bacterium (Candidatus Ratteibacteria) CG_4_10_14_3_um_filter_41_18]|uniref:Biotin carboxylase n=3 Tax=Candidatus Ratteibacteria TaxID=2979319 RepID=A0A2M7YF32_9BACT|nr:MAG: acetyl-CoA carboxylase biotin carboxylase subunit [bacterium (Candidatus Ratteibacteria) CG15_BIG_FIL_POST_REV_8_21_14_020_41_12]PIX77646.1 MAG: acetyl-CoA carboxylase biotin carboxylase subunit [bacterium (Candidatus Ratteibacteria) CG_4_10_14_3_um_filter_41_18]PJA61573.1 MAG: acetyl-CoA carboxylase biotin carboxylase subunit [bacterium (Candidatus Ratteibacteria) CG_4_9_14_3_um_filter_41_21]